MLKNFRLQIKGFSTIRSLQNTYCTFINNSSKKIAFFVPHTAASEYDFECKAFGHRLDQILYSTHIGFAVHKNNFIFKLLQNVTQQLIPAGIPQYLAKFFEWSIFKSHTEIIVKSPSVLTLSDLKFGFILWMYSCGVTILVFAYEAAGRIIFIEVKLFFIQRYFGFFLKLLKH